VLVTTAPESKARDLQRCMLCKLMSRITEYLVNIARLIVNNLQELEK
jgi:hypothetical protein